MEYDSVNRLTKYNGETVRYDADGNMTYGSLNGGMTDFTYDCRNRLIQAGDITYTYDAENNRIGMETPKKQVRYIVDSQQELTRILQANETETKTHEQKVTLLYLWKGIDRAGADYGRRRLRDNDRTYLLIWQNGQAVLSLASPQCIYFYRKG